MKKIVYLLKSCGLCLLPFVLLCLLDIASNHQYYLLDWMSRNCFVYLWITTLVLEIFKKKFGIFMSYANFLLVLICGLIGDLIRSFNMKKITIDMDGYHKYLLARNPAWNIWLYSLLTVACLYLLYPKIKSKWQAYRAKKDNKDNKDNNN